MKKIKSKAKEVSRKENRYRMDHVRIDDFLRHARDFTRIDYIDTNNPKQYKEIINKLLTPVFVGCKDRNDVYDEFSVSGFTKVWRSGDNGPYILINIAHRPIVLGMAVRDLVKMYDEDPDIHSYTPIMLNHDEPACDIGYGNGYFKFV